VLVSQADPSPNVFLDGAIVSWEEYKEMKQLTEEENKNGSWLKIVSTAFDDDKDSKVMG